MQASKAETPPDNWVVGLLCKSNLCKAVLLIIFVFLGLQYAANLFVYQHNVVHRMVPSQVSWLVPTVHNTTSATLAANSTHLPTNTSSLSLCPLVPPKLVGRLKVLTEEVTEEQLEAFFPWLFPGGRWWPSGECVARHRVAIIIPYRDRRPHLLAFLHNMHPVLRRQQLDYGIYVVEQMGEKAFNRAMLFNIGFKEALKLYDYQCFIFHDVDLIAEDDRNLYSCPPQPRHMSVAIDTMGYKLPYKTLFGGVSALTREQMEKLNGFSNVYWGWGGEDDDMSNRIKFHGMKIIRYSPDIARYTMMKHKKETPNPDRYNKLYRGKARYQTDGLNSLQYQVHDIVLKKLYTLIQVEIHKSS